MTGKLLFRKKRSEMIGDILVCLFLPAIDAAVDAEDRDATSLTLTRVAAALAVYRTQSGAYPESLDQMTPAILPTLPLDPYGAAPLHYERRGEGYVLYSVFQNGVDDGGRDFGGEIVGGEWLPADEKQDMSYESSDFVLRVPRPPLKVPVAPAAP